jgi:hypothetical protein
MESMETSYRQLGEHRDPLRQIEVYEYLYRHHIHAIETLQISMTLSLKDLLLAASGHLAITLMTLSQAELWFKYMQTYMRAFNDARKT